MASLKITYGSKGGPRSGHLREGRSGVSNPSFLVTPHRTPPLRLNTDVGVRFPPDQLAKLSGNREKLDYLRFEIFGALDLFAQYQRQFLDLYFSIIVTQCQDADRELTQTLAWSDGLFSAEDFVFSALWPLPDAQVSFLCDEGERNLGDFDFAFWTGTRVLGLKLAGSAPHPPLVSGHAHVAPCEALLPITVTATELQNGVAIFSAQRFPVEFLSFWTGATVPSSPFRPVGLATIQANPS